MPLTLTSRRALPSPPHIVAVNAITAIIAGDHEDRPDTLDSRCPHHRHRPGMTGVAFALDGRTLAGVGQNRRVFLWAIEQPSTAWRK